jgi:NAD(P)-dependent dehydrogenase (short-subunit alcohol dehydrogenase family)
MNSYDLTDQVAVITGGAQGIGLAIATRMAANGARIAIWDRDLPLAEAAAARLGGRAYLVDVAEEASVTAATRALQADLGAASILVTSAGVAGPNARVMDYDPAEWDRIIAINLRGTFLCCRALLPQMVAAGYGRIVTIASVAGKEGNPNAGAYSASKGAVMALTKSMGKEHAGQNIAINCITPATAKTRILDELKPEFIDYMLSRIPRGRFLEVEEAANMVCWLCSPENSFTTGAMFDLSGGRTTY